MDEQKKINPFAAAQRAPGVHVALQKPLPPTHLYLGEVDLARNVRALDDDLLTQLLTDLAAGAELSGPRRIFTHPATATSLPRGDGVETVACERLDQAVYATWPDLR